MHAVLLNVYENQKNKGGNSNTEGWAILLVILL